MQFRRVSFVCLVFTQQQDNRNHVKIQSPVFRHVQRGYLRCVRIVVLSDHNDGDLELNTRPPVLDNRVWTRGKSIDFGFTFSFTLACFQLKGSLAIHQKNEMYIFIFYHK